MTPFKTVHSLDFETTGIDPNSSIDVVENGIIKKKLKPRIWSAGVYTEGRSGVEAIFDTDSTGAARREEAAVLSKNKFYNTNQEYKDYVSGKKHHIDPNSKEVKFVYNDGNKGVSHFMDSVFKAEDSGMILVQNLAFERKHLSAAEGDVPGYLTSNMSEQNLNGKTKLYAPSGVTNAKRKLKGALSIAEKDKIYDEVVSEYEKADIKVRQEAERRAKNAVKGKQPSNVFYAADLMDFSKATLTKAAAKGFIPESVVENGTSIEFLAKMVLGETESHGALSDAKQQTRIFRRMLDIRNQLMSPNGLSQDNAELLKKMKAVSGTLKERAAAKSVLSNIDKLRENGTLDIREQIGSTYIETKDIITGEVNKVESTRFRPVESETSGLAKISELINSKYKGTKAADEFNKILEIHKGDTSAILGALKNDDLVKKLEDIQSKSEDLIDKVSMGSELTQEDVSIVREANSSERQSSRSGGVITRLEEEYIKVRNKHQFLKDILPENAKHGLLGLGAAAIGGGLWLASDSNDANLRVKKIKEKQERLDMQQYNDPTFRQFSGLDYQMPAGVGMANRKAYNHSYEY